MNGREVRKDQSEKQTFVLVVQNLVMNEAPSDVKKCLMAAPIPDENVTFCKTDNIFHE